MLPAYRATLFHQLRDDRVLSPTHFVTLVNMLQEKTGGKNKYRNRKCVCVCVSHSRISHLPNDIRALR